MVRSPSNSDSTTRACQRHTPTSITHIVSILYSKYDIPRLYVCQRRRPNRRFDCVEAASHSMIFVDLRDCSQKSMAYLFGRDDLKRAESSLQVGRVGLELVKSASNAGLKLRGLCARRAVGGDLVEGAHICGWCRCRCQIWRKFRKFWQSQNV